MSKIPKILIQTNIKKIEDHVISKLSNVFPGWNYYNFESDHKRIQFFLENPIDDFPNIVQKYNILQGAHKSDLLRYYFLYLFGGVYLDDDAMIYDNIDNIIKNYDCVFIKSNFFDSFTHIFNGFICTYPKNPIIYQALKHLYDINYNNIINYQFSCIELYNIIMNSWNINVKLYEETLKKTDRNDRSIIYGDDNRIILIHYFQHKKIPEN